MNSLKQAKHSPSNLLNIKDEENLLKSLLRMNNEQPNMILRGRKAVTKFLEKKNFQKECFVLIPINISPVDLITHLPFLCKENNIDYFYVSVENQNLYRKLSKKNTLSTCCLIMVDEDLHFNKNPLK